MAFIYRYHLTLFTHSLSKLMEVIKSFDQEDAAPSPTLAVLYVKKLSPLGWLKLNLLLSIFYH